MLLPPTIIPHLAGFSVESFRKKGEKGSWVSAVPSAKRFGRFRKISPIYKNGAQNPLVWNSQWDVSDKRYDKLTL